MISSQVYKLRPSSSQSAKMDSWLDMLRSHYNWCLADRIENYQQQFIQGKYCSLRLFNQDISDVSLIEYPDF